MSQSVAVYAVLAAVSLALYWPAFDNGFREDDYTFLYMASSAERVTDLAAPRTDAAFYRPGAWTLFAAEYRAFGMNAGRYIAFNWFLHAVNSLLLMAVLRRAGYGGRVAAWAAGLFVLGYGHFGKQVMWACTGGGLLAVALALVLALGSLRLCDTRAPAPRWLGPALALLALAAPAFHASMLLAPLVALALCWRAHGREAALARGTPLWWTASAALWAAVLVAVSPTHGAVTDIGHALATAPLRLVRYVGLMALPLQDSAVLSRMSPLLSNAAPVGQFLTGTIVLVGAALAARRRGTRLWALVAWMLLALSPFTLVGMTWHWLELRYVYFASVGFAGLVALALAGRPAPVRFAVLGVAVVVTVSVTTMLERKYDAAASNEDNRSRMEWLQNNQ